jgi:hypothetical protein
MMRACEAIDRRQLIALGECLQVFSPKKRLFAVSLQCGRVGRISCNALWRERIRRKLCLSHRDK